MRHLWVFQRRRAPPKGHVVVPARLPRTPHAAPGGRSNGQKQRAGFLDQFIEDVGTIAFLTILVAAISVVAVLVLNEEILNQVAHMPVVNLFVQGLGGNQTKNKEDKIRHPSAQEVNAMLNNELALFTTITENDNERKAHIEYMRDEWLELMRTHPPERQQFKPEHEETLIPWSNAIASEVRGLVDRHSRREGHEQYEGVRIGLQQLALAVACGYFRGISNDDKFGHTDLNNALIKRLHSTFTTDQRLRALIELPFAPPPG